MQGRFFVLEGLDGSGKTSVARRLADELRELGRDVVETREPGGTWLGEQVRTLLLDTADHPLLPATEALLFAAARAQHVGETIKPALERGADVVCDRFADSSLAYQWGGRGLDLEDLRAAQSLAIGDLEPDLKLLLDLPVEASLQRRRSSGEINRLDSEVVDFYERVREAYLQLTVRDPDRWRIIDASKSPAEVWQEVHRAVVSFDLPNERSRVSE
ncbi:MAG: dTMP kinase [Thermomicrobiales bacterium]